MNLILTAANNAIAQVLLSIIHNWPYLLASILIATALKLYVDQSKVSTFLRRNSRSGVVAATAAAVATPLCSCGTTAVVLGMMAGMMPWAPIIAFMVSSPLTSPEELFYSAGIFGWPFALTFFGASIALGLAGGIIGSILDRRGWLKNQARATTFAVPAKKSSAPVTASCCTPQIIPLQLATVSACACDTNPVQMPVMAVASDCGCGSSEIRLPVTPRSPACACDVAPVQMPVIAAASACGCDFSETQLPLTSAVPDCDCDATATTPSVPSQSRVQEFLKETFSTGKQLMKMYLGFAFIGFFLNGLIPTEWVSSLFGGNSFGVPLAATLGLPLYISTEASLPLIRALIDAGMSQGAAMAFMISGAGTSFGAIAGALTIARWRVVAVVVGVLWIGAIAFGYLYNAMLAMGLF